MTTASLIFRCAPVQPPTIAVTFPLAPSLYPTPAQTDSVSLPLLPPLSAFSSVQEVLVPSSRTILPPSAVTTEPSRSPFLQPCIPFPHRIPIQHTDDADPKETRHSRGRRCNCHTTEPPSHVVRLSRPVKISKVPGSSKGGGTHLTTSPCFSDRSRDGSGMFISVVFARPNVSACIDTHCSLTLFRLNTPTLASSRRDLSYRTPSLRFTCILVRISVSMSSIF